MCIRDSVGRLDELDRELRDAASMSAGKAEEAESARRKALPGWLHEYNHHRPHTATGRRPPITRLTNLSGQYS